MGQMINLTAEDQHRLSAYRAAPGGNFPHLLASTAVGIAVDPASILGPARPALHGRRRRQSPQGTAVRSNGVEIAIVVLDGSEHEAGAVRGPARRIGEAG